MGHSSPTTMTSIFSSSADILYQSNGGGKTGTLWSKLESWTWKEKLLKMAFKRKTEELVLETKTNELKNEIIIKNVRKTSPWQIIFSRWFMRFAKIYISITCFIALLYLSPQPCSPLCKFCGRGRWITPLKEVVFSVLLRWLTLKLSEGLFHSFLRFGGRLAARDPLFLFITHLDTWRNNLLVSLCFKDPSFYKWMAWELKWFILYCRGLVPAQQSLRLTKLM